MNPFRVYDYTDGKYKISWFLVGVVVVCTAFAVMAFTEIYLEVSTERKQIVCRVKQMDHMRPSFTSDVICVPYPMRQDTLTVK